MQATIVLLYTWENAVMGELIGQWVSFLQTTDVFLFYVKPVHILF